MKRMLALAVKHPVAMKSNALNLRCSLVFLFFVWFLWKDKTKQIQLLVLAVGVGTELTSTFAKNVILIDRNHNNGRKGASQSQKLWQHVKALAQDAQLPLQGSPPMPLPNSLYPKPPNILLFSLTFCFRQGVFDCGSFHIPMPSFVIDQGIHSIPNCNSVRNQTFGANCFFLFLFLGFVAVFFKILSLSLSSKSTVVLIS